jgi:hypothetical protein
MVHVDHIHFGIGVITPLYNETNATQVWDIKSISKGNLQQMERKTITNTWHYHLKVCTTLYCLNKKISSHS